MQLGKKMATFHWEWGQNSAPPPPPSPHPRYGRKHPGQAYYIPGLYWLAYKIEIYNYITVKSVISSSGDRFTVSYFHLFPFSIVYFSPVSSCSAHWFSSPIICLLLCLNAPSVKCDFCCRDNMSIIDAVAVVTRSCDNEVDRPPVSMRESVMYISSILSCYNAIFNCQQTTFRKLFLCNLFFFFGKL